MATSVPPQTVDPFSTNVTRTTHHTTYPSINPSRPELTQAGKTVLITGGTAGIGLAIATSFIEASASTVIITGRRQEQLNSATILLQEHAKSINSPTVIIAEKSDSFDGSSINALWDSLADRNIAVDVVIVNAARFAVPEPLLKLGTDHVWESFVANVRTPLHFAERLYKQKTKQKTSGGTKYLIYVSTEAINMSKVEYIPMSADRPEYGLTKGAGTWAMQFVAQEVRADEIQILSYHPGVVYSEAWQKMGASPDTLPFDDAKLAGDFAVWASTKEAKYLHGRFVWASWDVDELAKDGVKNRVEEDTDFLRVGIFGLKGANLA